MPTCESLQQRVGGLTAGQALQRRRVGRGGVRTGRRQWQRVRQHVPGTLCPADAGLRAPLTRAACAGFMSNRGRQNVASFLALDLGVDWRRGGDWFESLLLDYDVSRWGT